MKFSYTPKPKTSGQGGKFLKLGDGESVTGVFRGDIYTVFGTWTNNKFIPCAPDNPNAKARHKVNFVVQEQGKFVAKIFEMSDALYTRLYQLDRQIEMDTKDDAGGPKGIEMVKCRVSRVGKGKDDTKWSLDPVVGGLLSPGHLIAISQVELNILNGRKQEDPLPPPFDDGFPPDDRMPDFDEIPF